MQNFNEHILMMGNNSVVGFSKETLAECANTPLLKVAAKGLEGVHAIHPAPAAHLDLLVTGIETK
jgi:hypothetical protein